MTSGRPDRLAASGPPPAILVTRGDPGGAGDAQRHARGTELYAAAIARAGGEPIVVTPSTDRAAQAAALERMAGLLLSGGPDLSPDLYGRASEGTRATDLARDELELQTWRSATERRLPVLGICRGLQAINVFSGGTLAQHLPDHAGPGEGPALHRLRVVGGSQLARILRPTNPGSFVTRVNSSHHQGVRAADLASGLAASGWAPAEGGEIVEALEARDPNRLVLGLQCHPERTESTPPEFERLFRFFVDAAWHTTRGIASSPTG